MFEQYISNQYLRALLIFIALLFFLRLSVFIIERVILRLVSKTKTDLDDLIIQKSSKPLTLILFLVSIRIALDELTLPVNFTTIFHKLIYSAIIIIIVYLFYALLDIIIFRAWKKFVSRTKTKLDDSLFSLIHGALKVALIIIVLLYILDLWGVQIVPFLAGLGIAGLAVALALQPTLSNIFSGIAMILDKSVRVGDLIYLDTNTRGTVEKIGLRSTKIKTADNELIILPNSKIADSIIQNIALPEPKSRVVIPFSVAYGSNIEKVKSTVLKEIKNIKTCSKHPEPTIHFIEMGASSLNFKAFFFVDTYDHRPAAIDEANTKIYNALNKNKIEMPFPQLDVHLKRK